jgi:alpha-tubulin suppressor-like RCC1 family protein
VLALNRKGAIWSSGNNTYGQLNVPAAATNISSVVGTVYSSLASVGEGPPMLATPLVDRTVVSGATAYFRAYAYGAVPMSYQWRFHGTNVDGATNSIFAVPGIQPAQTGYCSVVVTNAVGAVTSADCFVSVLPLIINTHPASQAAYVGENITFSVGAAGQGPLAYQWHFNGADLLGATSSSLTLTNVQTANAGLYSVTVSNAYTSLLSSNASLTVTPILITTEPQSQSIFPGGTVTLSISALANSPLAYQWLFNGSALAAATASPLTLTNVQYDQAGIYNVTLTISGATTNSTDTILSVVPVAAWGWNPAGETTVPLGLTNVAALACSATRSLALKTDGTFVSWGQLYSGTPPPGTSNIVALAAGNHTAAIKTDGTVVVWGSNSFGETNVPPDLTNAIALAAGEEHTVALRSDGMVFAWGRNWEGQTNVPSGLSNVVAVAAGEWKSLALKADGTVVTWGFNGNSQTNAPLGLTNVVAIAGASYHSLALLDNGQVVSWGSSSWGENSLSVTDAIAIAAGYECSLALRADGTVVARGYPYNGQPIIPVGLANVQTLTSGEYHCLAQVGDAPPPLYSQVASPSLTTNGFSVTVQSRHGHVYRLEYKNALSDGSWIPLPLVAGTGQTLRLIDPSAAGAQRFYRVRQW